MLINVNKSIDALSGSCRMGTIGGARCFSQKETKK